MDFIFHIVKSFLIVSMCALLAKIKKSKIKIYRLGYVGKGKEIIANKKKKHN